jgi:DNA mismatch repair protein MSH4
MKAETKFETSRCYYLKIPETEFEGRQIPEGLINRVRKKGYIECQTMDLMKFNQKIEAAHQEIVMMSDKTIQALLDDIRREARNLYEICESVALLDMIAGLVQLATTSEDYVRPVITDAIAIKSGRHPIKEKVYLQLAHFGYGCR